jgi:hypothetical protein
MRRRRLAGLLAFGTLLGCAGCRPSVPFAERAFFSREPSHALPAAADCERCHQEVVVEWRASAHARAWTSEAFQAATHAGRAEACTSCHAPAPLAAGPPRLRAARLEEGVTCITCHLSTAPGEAPLTMRGPARRSLPVEVHPVIAEDPLYRSSELCGGCHEATYVEWRAAPEPAAGDKETCQGCHMPSVHRTVESVNDEVPYSPLFVALEETQQLRRHRFAVPDDADEEIVLALERRPAALLVRVENRLPHALPTGSFGRREVRLFVAWPGGSSEHAFAARPGASLAAGETRTVELPVAAAASRGPLSVALRRFDPARREWQDLVAASAPAFR